MVKTRNYREIILILRELSKEEVEKEKRKKYGR